MSNSKTTRRQQPGNVHLSLDQACKALRMNRIDLAGIINRGDLKHSPGPTRSAKRILKADLQAYARNKGIKLAAAGENILEFQLVDAPNPLDEGRKVFVLAAGTEPAVGDVARWDSENGDAITGTWRISGDPGMFVFSATEGEIQSVSK